MIQHIPFELQQLNQWVVASGVPLPNGDVDKKPRNPRTGALASVTDPDTWGSFSEAQASSHKLVGFVLSPNDPYTIIDLDDPRLNSEKKPETDAELVKARTQRHCKILEAFESYAEYSQSGGGIHIIVRGKIPKGCRKDRVEVYSEGRYMVCTGTPYNTLPITLQQDLLDKLFAEMATEREEVELVQRDSLISDADVCRMAYNASNGAKFWELWQGNWQGNPLYPSQSEADFALLSFLTFYTKDNEQVRRIFRTSALGKREKANKNDKYLNFALRKIRANEVPAVDLSELLKRAASIQNKHSNGNHVATNGTAPAKLPEAPQELPAPKKKIEKGFSYPPGFVGELARYFFKNAIMPVEEIALVAALGIMSGVIGRSYNISNTGLNQYLVLVAKTGTGKEGISNAIESIVSQVRSHIPNADQFMGPANFASGQGLVKTLQKQNCFVSVLGEFGIRVQEMCDPRANSAMQMLHRVLLDLYNKSGYSNVLRPTVHSDAEKNTQSVHAPCVSIIGETTPSTFYDKLDISHLQSGLIPRLTIIEYKGDAVNFNKKAGAKAPDELIEKFAEIVTVGLTTNQNRTFLPVAIDAESEAILDGFREWCRTQQNEGGEVEQQLWSRAHLKALRLAALVAVGINHHSTTVTAECARWACAFIHNETGATVHKFKANQFGRGEGRQESDLRRAMEAWFEMPFRERKTHESNHVIVEADAIPHSYMYNRVKNLASFDELKMKPSQVLKQLVANLIEMNVVGRVGNTPTTCYCKGNNWELWIAADKKGR